MPIRQKGDKIMLLVELKNEIVTAVFINKNFPKTQFQQEFDRYIDQIRFETEREKKEYAEMLLTEAQTLTVEVNVQVKVPTQITAQSGYAKEIKNLYRGDRVTIYSDANYKIKRAFWNKIRIFFNF